MHITPIYIYNIFFLKIKLGRGPHLIGQSTISFSFFFFFFFLIVEFGQTNSYWEYHFWVRAKHCVKLWFITMYLVGFYSVSNLIVILLNLLYLVFIVRFDCKGCVIERESVCEDPSYWRLKRFSRVSCDLASREVMYVPYTWLEYEESIQIEIAVSCG